MGFWSDLWAFLANGDASSKPEPLPPLIVPDDPDWEERCRLRDENRRLQKRFDLLKLVEDNAKLADECDKMQRRREERERRGR